METSSKSILNYWQPLVGIGTFLVAGGIFYNRMDTTGKKQTELEARQDRQFQLIQSMEKRINESEKWIEYQRGYEQAKKDLSK